jgi:hypothetical protein
MKLVTIKSESLKRYAADKEMLQKEKRPCVLIMRLSYKGRRYDFAVPIRSNINPSAPKWQYFPLPPRHTTKPNHHHEVHYIKMFPIDRSSAIKYRTEGNAQASLMKQILDSHEKEIIRSCQEYLSNYEKGTRPQYSTNIDLLIQILERGE